MGSTPTLRRTKRILAVVIAVAVVIAAGVVVGQAPALFGADVAADPEASIEFEDQQSDGTNVTIDSVSLSHGGFVVVSDGSQEFLAVSEYLEAGEHENVTVEQRENVDRELLGGLTATVHRDTTDDVEFAYEESEGEEDRPYLEHGYPVSERATVTLTDRPDDATDSFQVESVSGPTTGTTTQTVEFVGEVRNPADSELRQYAEFRVGGELIERQVLTLEGDETRELAYEVELATIGPGTHVYGIYTAEGGSLGEIEVEFDGPPSVSVTDADESSATVDAGLPEGGFVAIEDEDGDVVATSDELDPGLHEELTIEFDDPVEGNETLTAVAYEGDPEDLEGATAYEIDGERVEATVELAADEDDGDEDGEDDGAEEEENDDDGDGND